MSAPQKHHGPKCWPVDREGQVPGRFKPSPKPLASRSVAVSGVAQAKRAPSNGAGPGGENQDGSQRFRQEDPSRVRAGRGNGGRGTTNGGVEVPGRRPPHNTTAFGALRCHGEACPSRPSRCPAYRPVVVEERRPRGNGPRGPLRGGPERSACDSQRTPRISPCGGPARPSDDPRLQNKPTPSHVEREANQKKGGKWPTVVTVDKDGREACCGPLSR